MLSAMLLMGSVAWPVSLAWRSRKGGLSQQTLTTIIRSVDLLAVLGRQI